MNNKQNNTAYNNDDDNNHNHNENGDNKEDDNMNNNESILINNNNDLNKSNLLNVEQTDKKITKLIIFNKKKIVNLKLSTDELKLQENNDSNTNNTDNTTNNNTTNKKTSNKNKLYANIPLNRKCQADLYYYYKYPYKNLPSGREQFSFVNEGEDSILFWRYIRL